MRRWRETVADTVEGYLAQLKKALAGADPALVQDALYDAEEYLRNAVAEGDGSPEAIEAAIEAYGTPEEVAVAYRESEAAVTAALRKPRAPAPASGFAASPLGRFFGVILDPAAYGALFYMLLALATGIIYFTIVVTGLSLSLGLLVLIIGIPFALLFLAVVRAISLAEGRMVEGLLGVRMPRRPRTLGVQGNLWTRIKSWLTDYRSWTTMLYMVLQLPLGVIYFTIVVTALSLSLGLLVGPPLSAIVNQPIIVNGDFGYALAPWAIPLLMAVGVLGFFITLWMAKGIGYVHGQWAKMMLVGRLEAAGAEDSWRPAGSGTPASAGAVASGETADTQATTV
jgi:uncharacterized membrane protein